MSRPYVGDHDMEEILRLTGEDTFAGRGRDRGSLRNYRYDSGLSESVQPIDVQSMLEAADDADEDPSPEKVETAWHEAFPAVNPVDDFESWAAARDDENDKTPAGVMGEASGPPYTGLVLDLDYHPSSSGGRVTIGNGLLPAQQSALTAVQKELDATFGTTVIKRVAGSLSLHVKDGSPAALVVALRKIGKALGMELSKTLKESRELSLRELAESGGRGTRRPAPLKEVPITGSPKRAVEDLDRLLKSLRG